MPVFLPPKKRKKEWVFECILVNVWKIVHLKKGVRSCLEGRKTFFTLKIQVRIYNLESVTWSAILPILSVTIGQQVNTPLKSCTEKKSYDRETFKVRERLKASRVGTCGIFGIVETNSQGLPVPAISFPVPKLQKVDKIIDSEFRNL